MWETNGYFNGVFFSDFSNCIIVSSSTGVFVVGLLCPWDLGYDERGIGHFY
jgi:hypothetical protein